VWSLQTAFTKSIFYLSAPHFMTFVSTTMYGIQHSTWKVRRSGDKISGKISGKIRSIKSDFKV
jgi:hypothetical protein